MRECSCITHFSARKSTIVHLTIVLVNIHHSELKLAAAQEGEERHIVLANQFDGGFAVFRDMGNKFPVLPSPLIQRIFGPAPAQPAMLSYPYLVRVS